MAAPTRTTTSAMNLPRPLFRGYALIAASIAWTVGIVLAQTSPLTAIDAWVWAAAAAGCAAVGLALWVWRRRPAAGSARAARAFEASLVLAVLGLWVALGAARAAWTNTGNGTQLLAALAHGQTVHIQGDVAAEPIIESTGRLLVIDVSSISSDGGATWAASSGHVEVHISGPDDWFAPAYGDTLQLTGKLQPATRGAPAGVVARLASARAQITARGGGNPLLAWLFDLRVRLAQALQRVLPEPEAALLIGILLGLKTPVLRARLQLFTNTGTIHLVVPAGLKVSLLSDIARRALSPFGRWPATTASMLAVAAYAALGGGGPAALRAAIMGALLALAPALGRRYDVYSALALAVVVMTGVEPLLVFDVGFQLTTLATLGIPLLAPTLQTWLRRPIARVPGATLFEPVVELVAVTLAAQIATLPVLMLTFGVVSFVAPLANLLTVPLLAPLLVLGVALALGALAAPPVALALAVVTWPLLWLVDQAIALCAGLPGAALAVPATPMWVALAYYGALLIVIGWAWWLAARRTRVRVAAGLPPQPMPPASAHPHRPAAMRVALAGLCALVVVGLCGAAAPVVASSTARVDFLNVGAGGEATLLRLADGTSVLIDGGPAGPPLEEALAARLPLWQRSLDLTVLTDPGAGAMTGLEDAITHFTVGRAADGGMLHPTTLYLTWRDALTRSHVPHTIVRQDDVIHLSDTTTLRVLSPPQGLFLGGGGATTHSNDLILRLETPGLRVLMLGSADNYALDALALAGEPLAADVVEVALPPQTGIDLGGPLGHILLAAHPRLVVVAQGARPSPSHSRSVPAPTTIWPPDAPTAQTLGAMILRIADVGTVSLTQRHDSGWDLEGA